MKGIMTEKEMRELNCWIAEHVFGGVWYRFKDLEYLKRSDPDDGAFIVIGIDLKHFKSNKDYCPDTGELPHKGFSWIPKYTTDPAAAMMVWGECLKKCDVEITQWQDATGRFHIATFHRTIWVDAETLPLAIANFAKKMFEPK